MKNLKNYPVLLMMIAMLFLSCEELLTEEDITEETVVLTAPSDEAAFTETDIVLSWEPVEGADSYQLQIATPSFEAALQIVEDSVLAENHFPAHLDPNDYEWRVKALNSAYETEFSTQSFTINE